ncbi:MAG: hypothetical protein C4278_01435 [Patescibacteria group bacterium]
MNKNIIIIIVIIIAIGLIGVGYFLISKKSPTLPLSELERETVEQHTEKLPPQETIPLPSEKKPFDTNDNLDQALQELEELESF